MKLNYRGADYESTSVDADSMNSQSTAADLFYRGVSYHADFPAEAATQVVNSELTYRGVHYGQGQMTAPSAPEATPATLKYRGVAYPATSQPAPNVTTELTYRGVTYSADNTPSVSPAADLSYRGVAYTKGAAAAAAEVEAPAVSETVLPAVQPASSTNERARILMMNHHRMVKQRQQVMLVRLAESVGLPVDQTALYWNHIQGKVHPSFWATYDRSHVSAS